MKRAYLWMKSNWLSVFVLWCMAYTVVALGVDLTEWIIGKVQP